jgi:hypothetical protein
VTVRLAGLIAAIAQYLLRLTDDFGQPLFGRKR